MKCNFSKKTSKKKGKVRMGNNENDRSRSSEYLGSIIE